MNNLEEVRRSAMALNDAINKLNAETRALESVVAEKRTEKCEQILTDLTPYVEIMSQLDIDSVDFKTKTYMFYKGMSRPMGIKLRRWTYADQKVVQIDLGVYSSIEEDFCASHSMGEVAWGGANESILSSFCKNWEHIRDMIDRPFADKVERILQKRTEQAFNDREQAIRSLTKFVSNQ